MARLRSQRRAPSRTLSRAGSEVAPRCPIRPGDRRRSPALTTARRSHRAGAPAASRAGGSAAGARDRGRCRPPAAPRWRAVPPAPARARLGRRRTTRSRRRPGPGPTSRAATHRGSAAAGRRIGVHPASSAQCPGAAASASAASAATCSGSGPLPRAGPARRQRPASQPPPCSRPPPGIGHRGPVQWEVGGPPGAEGRGPLSARAPSARWTSGPRRSRSPRGGGTRRRSRAARALLPPDTAAAVPAPGRPPVAYRRSRRPDRATRGMDAVRHQPL
jgi:hypothetical protein